MEITPMQQLYLELESLEHQGITIWLEGLKSSPEYIANHLNIHDENLYMRDYIFDEGRLKEIHFNKIQK